MDGLWATKSEGVVSVQLVSKISNLCDPDPPTSQTDGQTDGRHAISILRYALVHHAVTKLESEIVKSNGDNATVTYCYFNCIHLFIFYYTNFISLWCYHIWWNKYCHNKQVVRIEWAIGLAFIIYNEWTLRQWNKYYLIVTIVSSNIIATDSLFTVQITHLKFCRYVSSPSSKFQAIISPLAALLPIINRALANTPGGRLHYYHSRLSAAGYHLSAYFRLRECLLDTTDDVTMSKWCSL